MVKRIGFTALVPSASREVGLRSFYEPLKRFEPPLAKAWDMARSNMPNYDQKLTIVVLTQLCQ